MSVLTKEVWLRAISYLRLPDLVHLACSSSLLRDLCSDALKAETQLRDRYRSTRVESCGHRDFTIHELLLGVLRGDIPPEYIEALELPEEFRGEFAEHHNWDCDLCSNGRRTSNAIPDQHTCQTKLAQPSNDERLRRCLEASPWIEDHEVEDFVTKVNDGDDAAIACVLLPLLPNLRYLMLPANPSRLLQLVTRIANASQHQVDSPTSGEAPHALSSLRMITNKASNGTEWGITLADAAPFLALPNVQKFILYVCLDDEFQGWPRGLEECRVSEIYFQECRVSREAVSQLAQCIHRPCVLRRILTPGDDLYDDILDWDHVVVEGDVDPNTGTIRSGTKRVSIETRHLEEDCPLPPMWSAARRH